MIGPSSPKMRDGLNRWKCFDTTPFGNVLLRVVAMDIVLSCFSLYVTRAESTVCFNQRFASKRASAKGFEFKVFQALSSALL